ncbi:hypothetical protein ACOJUR_15655 [Alicyclobacillus tolerans]
MGDSRSYPNWLLLIALELKQAVSRIELSKNGRFGDIHIKLHVL